MSRNSLGEYSNQPNYRIERHGQSAYERPHAGKRDGASFGGTGAYRPQPPFLSGTIENARYIAEWVAKEKPYEIVTITKLARHEVVEAISYRQEGKEEHDFDKKDKSRKWGLVSLDKPEWLRVQVRDRGRGQEEVQDSKR